MSGTQLVLLLLSVLLFFEGPQSSCQTKAGLDSAETPSSVRLINPRLAAGLSVLVPGLGSIYAGEPIRGAMHFGSFAGAIALVVSSKISDTHDSITPFGWISVFTLAATYVWGIVDCALLGDRSVTTVPASPPTLHSGINSPPRYANWPAIVSLQIPL